MKTSKKTLIDRESLEVLAEAFDFTESPDQINGVITGYDLFAFDKEKFESLDDKSLCIAGLYAGINHYSFVKSEPDVVSPMRQDLFFRYFVDLLMSRGVDKKLFLEFTNELEIQVLGNYTASLIRGIANELDNPHKHSFQITRENPVFFHSYQTFHQVRDIRKMLDGMNSGSISPYQLVSSQTFSNAPVSVHCMENGDFELLDDAGNVTLCNPIGHPVSSNHYPALERLVANFTHPRESSDFYDATMYICPTTCFNEDFLIQSTANTLAIINRSTGDVRAYGSVDDDWLTTLPMPLNMPGMPMQERPIIVHSAATFGDSIYLALSTDLESNTRALFRISSDNIELLGTTELSSLMYSFGHPIKFGAELSSTRLKNYHGHLFTNNGNRLMVLKEDKKQIITCKGIPKFMRIDDFDFGDGYIAVKLNMQSGNLIESFVAILVPDNPADNLPADLNFFPNYSLRYISSIPGMTGLAYYRSTVSASGNTFMLTDPEFKKVHKYQVNKNLI